MHITTPSLRSALAHAFQIPLRQYSTSLLSRNTTKAMVNSQQSHPFAPQQQSSPFSSSTSRAAKGKKGRGIKPDRRITLIRYFLNHPTFHTPRPLRFSRTRYLRHWTIHRAWNLFSAKMKKERALELERQYNAMAAANEELRVNAGDAGRLFRMAQMKTGVWGIPERGAGVPVEYARGLVEWIGSTGGLGEGSQAGGKQAAAGKLARVWDSEWKRH
ncbi:hypothetical protein B0A52_09463 [Exophiala mesophila]|uniref:Uncharacterized protein n=1 Tax=Exophiala mesophila TaxID=212818 RepID=A0A438MSD7_EXOME|nr:hypothetical protein B0A52_09463 [Exophiala mesophila]